MNLLQGDCLELMADIPDGSIDAVVTDPPYKLSQRYTANVDADNLIAVSGIWIAAQQLYRITKAGGMAAVFYDMRILPLALRAFMDAGWQYLRGLTFYRRWGNAHIMNGWMSTSDFVLIFAKPGEKPVFHSTMKHDVYIKAHPDPDSTGHPAQKPIEFLTQIIENITPPNGVVLDPYMGSGSTGVAATINGYQFIGMEREKEYFCEAQKRIQEAQNKARQLTLEGVA